MIPVIKPLEQADVPYLVEFLEKNNFEHFNPHRISSSYIQTLILDSIKDVYVVVRIKDFGVIAYGMLRGLDEGYTVPSLGIAVDKDFSGLGLGKIVMDYLHFVAKVNGYTHIMLRVHKDNYAAVSLYKKLGYLLTEAGDDYLKGLKKL